MSFEGQEISLLKYDAVLSLFEGVEVRRVDQSIFLFIVCHKVC
jgi:hypothetical protein